MTDFIEPGGVDSRTAARPAVGYALALMGAALFAVNGTVSKVILEAGVPPARLTELRSTASFLVLFVGLLLLAPSRLPLRRAELPRLVLFGAAGFMFVQWLYFIAISRLPVGVALLIEYTAPVMVTLYARFVLKERVRARMWAGLGLALLGLALIAQVWSGAALDLVGVVAGLGAAAALATYYVSGEGLLKQRDAISLTTWGMGFAAALSAIILPWWTFPWHSLDGSATVSAFGYTLTAPLWAFCAWLVVLGTIVPFLLVVSCLRHLRAAQAGIVGMTEPVLAALVAYVVLGESLSPVQLAGGAVVLVAVVLAETAR